MPNGFPQNLDGGYASVDEKTPLTQVAECYWLLHINGFPVKKKGQLGKRLRRYWLACIVANGCYRRRSVTPPPHHAATNQHVLSGAGHRGLPKTWWMKRWDGWPTVSSTQGNIQDWQLPIAIWQQLIVNTVIYYSHSIRLKSSCGLVSNSQRAVCLCHDPLWWILWSPFLMMNYLISIHSWDIKSKPNYPIITRKHTF